MHWKTYWHELQRRNVIRAGIAYLVVAWLITQVLSIVLPAFGARANTVDWRLFERGVISATWFANVPCKAVFKGFELRITAQI